ncbi:MAG: saccharopine dehydrogenase C-terminal domain-containing protein [Flavobacteriales bacterium]|nr:saccharopine dehydrogenase C-terminal domain-containing protein [Flavobacteriales bacterium]
MRKILILGAGRSAASLITYLVEKAGEQDWRVTVADRSPEQARKLVGAAGDAADVVALDASDAGTRGALVASHDLVISMLPAAMHMDVVHDCLQHRKHVLTPSYVPKEMWALDAQAKEAGLVFLNELGLDPGIDHLSAMRILDRLRAEGASLEAFESYTGGLVAPESDDNPWGYKFSWNPRNVVLAGQGGAACFIRDGRYRYIPYHRLFTRVQHIEVPGYGAFDGYANRDSLKYRKVYGLEDIPTLIRGTLRRQGFCAAWNVFVQLGCTDDSYAMEVPADMTWSSFFDAFLPPAPDGDLRASLSGYLGLDPTGQVMDQLDWLGVFGNEPVGLTAGSPAQLLQHLLEQKWALGAGDKDMIVMQHVFRYARGAERRRLSSSLVVEGRDRTDTAMARTVGLPLAIAARLVLNGQVAERGVLLPLSSGLYDPILDELEELGIAFREQEEVLPD